jgi:hypothetical protein
MRSCPARHTELFKCARDLEAGMRIPQQGQTCLGSFLPMILKQMVRMQLVEVVASSARASLEAYSACRDRALNFPSAWISCVGD